MKRRDFIKIAAGAGLLSAVGAGRADARPAKSVLPGALGLLYDSTLCIGCKACVVGCREANELKPEHSSPEMLWDDPIDLSAKTYNIIKAYRGGGETKDAIGGFAFIKRQCMHCVDPSCVSACPVSALLKDPDTGIVTYRKEACLGCRYCQMACPFNIPKFEWDKPFPQIRKCELCKHRIEKGQIPGCADSCPSGATLFGKTTELLQEAKRRLSMKPGEMYNYPINSLDSKVSRVPKKVSQYQPTVYGENEAGGTQCMMLSGVPFELLGMPALPSEAPAKFTETLQHSMYFGMIPPVVVFGGLAYAVYRNTKKDDKS